MANLRDVMAYICTEYPHKNELSCARLTKMIYLSDWRSVLTFGHQVTQIDWIFNHYGPYVSDVEDLAREEPGFQVIETTNFYGTNKEIISFVGDQVWPTMTEEDKSAVDFVIRVTAPMYWNEFIKLVYSTYPIATEPKHSRLNLVELANAYLQSKGATTEVAEPGGLKAR